MLKPKTTSEKEERRPFSTTRCIFRSVIGNTYVSPLYIISRKNFKNESYTPKGHVLIK
jgi:hypothetical protein